MAPHTVLIADPLAEEGLKLLRDNPAFEATVKTGLDEAALADAVGEYEGLIVRSGVRVTPRVLARPGRLRIISRAGVGVDNIDLPAATAAGVIVVNTPDANTLSTAEHTLAMMLSLARRVPQAHQHVSAGGWERGKFKGVQLADKTLGIVGFGRIGRAVAARALAMNMNVVAFDPYVGDETAFGGRVRIHRDLGAVLRQADVVTLHAALTEGTQRLISAETLSQMKRGALLVNCARGELIDEATVAEALASGQLGGAAVDVYSSEPPENNPLVGLPNVVHTPHLGASTVEAQRAVSIDAVHAVIEYLRDGRVRNAVNVLDLPHDLSPRELAQVDLAERMGRLLSPLCSGGIRRVRLTVRGEALGPLAMWLGRHLMVRLIGGHLSGPISVVNVIEVAAERGIEFNAVTAPGNESLLAEIEAPGCRHAVEAAVTPAGQPRIRRLDGHALDMTASGQMVIVANEDKPGAIGLVATAFGDAGVNIADLSVSRSGSEAMMIFKIDAPAPAKVLDAIRARPIIRSVYTVELPDAPPAADDDDAGRGGGAA